MNVSISIYLRSLDVSHSLYLGGLVCQRHKLMKGPLRDRYISVLFYLPAQLRAFKVSIQLIGFPDELIY